ncbi:unnamed protein product [Gordionus sp. m RMFG-2023]
MLDNLPEDICYIVIAPIVSMIGVSSNIYLLSLSGYLEKNYPTGMGYVRFLNIADLAVGLFSFIWPWLYNLSKHVKWSFSYNLYWVTYMSFFNPVFRNTWSKVISFLLLMFSIERYIVVVRRNHFTLLRNIEFVKFISLLCLSAALLISIPRVAWYKVTYLNVWPSNVGLSNDTLKEFGQEGTFYEAESGQTLTDEGEMKDQIITEPDIIKWEKKQKGDDRDNILKKRSVFLGNRTAARPNHYLNYFPNNYPSYTTTADLKETTITSVIVTKPVTQTLYFRETRRGVHTFRSYILENLLALSTYIVILILTINNLRHLSIMDSVLKQMKRRGNYKSMSLSFRLKATKGKNGSARETNPFDAIDMGKNLAQGNKKNKRVAQTGHPRFRMWAIKIYDVIVIKGITRLLRRDKSELLHNPFDTCKLKRPAVKGSYGLMTTPEKEITLLRLQVWSTLFKFICIFPNLVMIALYPLFDEKQMAAFPRMPDASKEIYFKLLPIINILEYVNIAVTPWIMIMILPEIRSITKDSLMCRRNYKIGE